MEGVAQAIQDLLNVSTRTRLDTLTSGTYRGVQRMNECSFRYLND